VTRFRDVMPPLMCACRCVLIARDVPAGCLQQWGHRRSAHAAMAPGPHAPALCMVYTLDRFDMHPLGNIVLAHAPQGHVPGNRMCGGWHVPLSTIALCFRQPVLSTRTHVIDS
jgi:hypothetical protein